VHPLRNCIYRFTHVSDYDHVKKSSITYTKPTLLYIVDTTINNHANKVYWFCIKDEEMLSFLCRMARILCDRENVSLGPIVLGFFLERLSYFFLFKNRVCFVRMMNNISTDNYVSGAND
jgi:hypothetical protein